MDFEIHLPGQRLTAQLHRTVARPWGTYTILGEGSRYKIKRIEVMELLVNGKMPNQEAAESLRAYEGSFGSGRTKGTIRPMSCFHPSKEVSEAKTTPLRSSPFSRVSIPLRKFRKTGL